MKHSTIYTVLTTPNVLILGISINSTLLHLRNIGVRPVPV